MIGRVGDTGGDVRLRRMTERDVDDVVDAAVAGTSPADVMPVPDDGGDRWTDDLARGYAGFLRGRIAGVGDATGEVSWVVDVDGRPSGVARLHALGPSSTVGIWLVTSVRGRGVAAAALDRLIDIARASGAEQLVADTTEANTAALAVLRRHSADLTRRGDTSGVVDARIPLRP